MMNMELELWRATATRSSSFGMFGYRENQVYLAFNYWLVFWIIWHTSLIALTVQNLIWFCHSQVKRKQNKETKVKCLCFCRQSHSQQRKHLTKLELRSIERQTHRKGAKIGNHFYIWVSPQVLELERAQLVYSSQGALIWYGRHAVQLVQLSKSHFKILILYK